MTSLDAFHPTVRRWFEHNFDAPTPVQQASWPVIAGGKHALITAPTGSGKTLTAFLWSLSQFAAGGLETGNTKVLYVSPLKALNNDIQQNLLMPLTELVADYNMPPLQVRVRSGDTEQSERQRMLRKPPDILITTPESLSLMLTTEKGQSALQSVATVIVDEIHALVENRRGVNLMTALEQLSELSGEFQRIALSATVTPLDEVARYFGGRTADGQPRRVRRVNVASDKAIDLKIKFPATAHAAAERGEKIWQPLCDDFRQRITQNRSTLLFVNSRRLAEKITLEINQGSDQPKAYAHHGSLAKDVRHAVETRLKAGDLDAIVATNSLEMGIDIGDLDEVIMVQSPPSVAATLQRIGRAGHRVNEVSRGSLYPSHAQDFIEAAALANAVAERDIEPLQLLYNPLDVLAQIIIGMVAHRERSIDSIYRLLRQSGPYVDLERGQFDLIIDMLSGRYAGSRVRELKPRIVLDRVTQRIKANRGAVLALYSSGGSIPDRGYFQLKHKDSGAKLGELDEEFVWEATTGDSFTLGTQHWRIHSITHNDVLVTEARSGTTLPPFWRSETFNRSVHFSAQICDFLYHAEQSLGSQSDLAQELVQKQQFEEAAAAELVDYLKRQREHTRSALPNRTNVLFEHVLSGPAGYQGPDQPQQLVIHTHWGGRINRPWALALDVAWRQHTGRKPELHADNNVVVIQCKSLNEGLAQDFAEQLLGWVNSDNLLTLLRERLEASGFFGARFRECAGRALLLNKQRFNQRLPLWMSRLQAKKLMSKIKSLDDFPIMLETWRTCLHDEFDLSALGAKLNASQTGDIQASLVTTQTPSPFAQNVIFDQVSRYMYADDTPEDETPSAIRAELIQQAVFDPTLRPKINPQTIIEFIAKRQRRAPGYEPSNPEEWGEWLKERVLIPIPELPSDPQLPKDAITITVDHRQWLTHRELVHGLHNTGLLPGPAPTDAPALIEQRSALELCREILSFYGPLTEEAVTEVLPTLPAGVLSADETFVQGALVQDSTQEHWCDADNLETLIRFQRAAQRQTIEPLSRNQLVSFWSNLHELTNPSSEETALTALELLRTYPASIATWLRDLLPARGHPPSVLENALQRFDLRWQGTAKQYITVGYAEDLALLGPSQNAAVAKYFTDPQGRYSYSQIADRAVLTDGELTASELNEQWWQSVWQGQLSSDSLEPLRQGILRKFSLAAFDARSRMSRRRVSALRAAPGWSGNWRLNTQSTIDDPLDQLEANKERVRLLLDRYGWINRDLVNRERLPVSSHSNAQGHWRWRDAFMALRVMELAGEVSLGHFVADAETPQFATPSAINAMGVNLPPAPVFWLAATDPVAPCGLGLAWPELPRRTDGNYLVFCAGELALVVENYGARLQYFVSPEHPELMEINQVLAHLLHGHQRSINISTINGESALANPYLEGLRSIGLLSHDHKQVTLTSI